MDHPDHFSARIFDAIGNIGMHSLSIMTQVVGGPRPGVFMVFSTGYFKTEYFTPEVFYSE